MHAYPGTFRNGYKRDKPIEAGLQHDDPMAFCTYRPETLPTKSAKVTDMVLSLLVRDHRYPGSTAKLLPGLLLHHPDGADDWREYGLGRLQVLQLVNPRTAGQTAETGYGADS